MSPTEYVKCVSEECNDIEGRPPAVWQPHGWAGVYQGTDVCRDCGGTLESATEDELMQYGDYMEGARA